MTSLQVTSQSPDGSKNRTSVVFLPPRSPAAHRRQYVGSLVVMDAESHDADGHAVDPKTPVLVGLEAEIRIPMAGSGLGRK